MGADMHYQVENVRRAESPRLQRALSDIAKIVGLPLEAKYLDEPSGLRQDHLEAIVDEVRRLKSEFEP